MFNRKLFSRWLQSYKIIKIGWCFENGKGRDIDLDQALFWYRKAAAQGDQRAMDAVERLLHEQQKINNNHQQHIKHLFFCDTKRKTKSAIESSGEKIPSFLFLFF